MRILKTVTLCCVELENGECCLYNCEDGEFIPAVLIAPPEKLELVDEELIDELRCVLCD